MSSRRGFFTEFAQGSYGAWRQARDQVSVLADAYFWPAARKILYGAQGSNFDFHVAGPSLYSGVQAIYPITSEFLGNEAFCILRSEGGHQSLCWNRESTSALEILREAFPDAPVVSEGDIFVSGQTTTWHTLLLLTGNGAVVEWNPRLRLAYPVGHLALAQDDFAVSLGFRSQEGSPLHLVCMTFQETVFILESKEIFRKVDSPRHRFLLRGGIQVFCARKGSGYILEPCDESLAWQAPLPQRNPSDEKRPSPSFPGLFEGMCFDEKNHTFWLGNFGSGTVSNLQWRGRQLSINFFNSDEVPFVGYWQQNNKGGVLTLAAPTSLHMIEFDEINGTDLTKMSRFGSIDLSSGIQGRVSFYGLLTQELILRSGSEVYKGASSPKATNSIV